MKATLASALNRTRSAEIAARVITTKRMDNRGLQVKNRSREKGIKKTYFQMVRNVENLLVQRILFLFLLLFFQWNKICKEEKNEKEIKISVSIQVAF